MPGPLTLNSTSAALLGLLHDDPAPGGALARRARDRFGGLFPITRSQVYRELPALAAAGYVRAGITGSRASQPYAITAAGKRAFAAWLDAPLAPDHLRNPLIMRLGFAHHHSAAQLRALITQADADHGEALAQARTRLAELRRGGADAYLVAAAEFSVSYERALLKWLGTIPVP